ncbi:MAG: tetratricopeptide repeat protein [Gammaproteobacteria bacterium]|nr:tetratricopeptide repeat protein [Gammaproteobacteria bacterium]
MNNHIKHHTNRLLYTGSVAAVLLMLLSGCSALKEKPEQGFVAGETGLVAPQLDEQTLFLLLAGELSGHQGDMETALKYYLPAAENSDDPRIAARAARIAIYAKQNDAALRASERWLELAPNDQQAIKILIIALLRSDQVDRASVQIIELIKLIKAGENITDKQVFAAIAKLLQNEAETADAVLVFKSLSRHDSHNAQVFLWLSRYAMQAGQYDEALSAITRVIELEPEHANAYVLKGRLLALSGKDEEAVAAMLVAVNKQPDDFVLRKQYAGMLIRQGKLDEANEQFERLFKAKPDDRETIISLGVLLLEKNQTERASNVLKRLQNNKSTENEALYYLARVEEVKNDFTKALGLYQQVEHGRLYFDAQLRMASIYAHLGKRQQAVALLQALSLKEDDTNKKAKIYLLHGRILQNAGDNKAAMAVYSSALDELPTHIDLLYAHALTAESLDMIDSAVAGLKKLLKQEPENIQALNALGYTLADRTNRFEEALEYILKAYQLKPDDAAIKDSLGWVHFRLGNIEEALKWLQQAFKSDNDPEIAAHLGEVLWKAGRTDDAEKVWQKVDEEHKKNQILIETIKRLK